MPIVIVMLVLNDCQRETWWDGVMWWECSSSVALPSLFVGTSCIPHFGQWPGELDLTSGCIAQV